MSKGLFFIAAVGAGATAIYLMDEKNGKKRRARLKKQLNQGTKVANDLWNEYSKTVGKTAQQLSKEYGPLAQEYGKKIGSVAADYGREFGTRARDYSKVAGSRSADFLVKANTSRFAPSTRLMGAFGSALAFYGAGRKGFVGVLIRTLSLGCFMRALIASR